MMRNKIKKISFFSFLLIFALSGICSAAKSSSRPASRPSTPITRSAPATESTPTSGYKPSAPASSYTDKAPDIKQSATNQMPSQSTGSSWMRSAGMFAGGMMMGGLLSNMMGYGNSGLLANIMGMLISFVPIILIFMLGRFLWNRYKNKQEDDQRNNRYR